jgi:hypothetical protein
MASTSKGILFTLLTILLFILMLGTLITYVILNINSENLASSSALGIGTQSVITAASGSAHDFLQGSLSDALHSLIAYESTPSLRHDRFVNNTAGTLESMIYNGTAFGMRIQNMSVTLSNYTSQIEGLAEQQDIRLTIENASVSVFQTTPYSINASYTALDVINTTTGIIYYPVNATAGVQLNGTVSLASAEEANPTVMTFSNYTATNLVGGVRANNGSQSPFMFVYGTMVVIPSGTPTCSAVPQKFRNGDFILAAANSVDINQSICGMGGLVTASLNQTGFPPLGPYLAYGNTGIFNSISNGTALLLDGNALELLNISAAQYYGVQKGDYFASKFVPSYLDRADGHLADKSPYGIFSLGGLSTLVASFADNGNIIVANSNTLNPGSNTMSAFAWVYLNTTTSTANIIQKPGAYGIGIGTGGAQKFQPVGSVGSNGICNSPPFVLSQNAWHFIGFTYNGTSINDYVDGTAYCSVALEGNVPSNSNSVIIGGSLNSSIAEVQVYNTSLSPQQVARLYSYGLSSIPISGAGLLLWMPLNGNSNDYSGFSYNIIATNTIYSNPVGYFGDPGLGELPGYASTYVIQGLLNCMNIQQCSNSTLSHVYLGNSQSGTSSNTVANEAAAFGLGVAGLPNALRLNGTGNANAGNGGYMIPDNGFAFMANSAGGFTISLWVYPMSGNGVIVDQGTSQVIGSGNHESIIELINGNVWMRGSGGNCSDIGTIQLDHWSNIIMTGTLGQASGFFYTGIINGNVIVAHRRGARGTTGSSPLYGLGMADLNHCSGGTGDWFNGMMSDYQIYNTTLTTGQAQQLYVNGTVPGESNSLVASWALYGGLNGLFNETPESQNGNTGYLWYFNVTSGVCTNSNVIVGACRASYSHP